MISIFTFNVIKILILAAASSMIAWLISSPLIKFLNKIEFWKKTPRKKTIDGKEAEVFNKLHSKKETTVPRGGGLVIWSSVIVMVLIVLILRETGIWWLEDLNFLSRGETWLPLFALLTGSLLGLADDIAVVYGKGKYIGGGLSFKCRLFVISMIGLVAGIWFYYKLGWSTIHLPLIGVFPEGIDVSLGFFYIPFVIMVALACWAGGVVDGLDGLAGGTFVSIFGAFAVISFAQGKADLAAFCAILCGTLFAFLWFNIPPAKFYMTETGILGLTSTLTVVAFMTDSIAVLPIIAGILVLEAGSVIIQLLSKKFRGKKIWLCTPIHHHFEAKGWPSSQVTMRFWLLGIVLAIMGTSIRLLS